MFLLNFFYILFSILLFPFWLKYLFKAEYRKIFKQRFVPGPLAEGQRRIWIHAVSVGEVKSLKGLIHILTERYQRQVVLSVTTPSGFEFARTEMPDTDIINAPFDFSFIIRRFIRAINPEIIILNELELWPNWILAANRNNIPMVVINGRISKNAFKSYRRFSFLFNSIWKKINLFMVQTPYHKEKFMDLNIPEKKVKVCGNIKADEAIQSLPLLEKCKEIIETLKIADNRKKIVVVASSHAGDERILLPAIKKHHQRYLFVLAPRHMERIPEIKESLKRHQVSFKTWSECLQVNSHDHLLLLDKMGYLFNTLKIADLVFMWGTFDQKVGGHNLYEPAALGKIILGGEYINNFPDIGQQLKQDGVYHVVPDSAALMKFLDSFDTINFDAAAELAHRAVFTRMGSVECILKQIQQLVKL